MSKRYRCKEQRALLVKFEEALKEYGVDSEAANAARNKYVNHTCTVNCVMEEGVIYEPVVREDTPKI